MVSKVLGRLIRAWARLLHALHLFWIVRWVANHLPPRVRLRLSKVQLRLGYMQGMVLVPEDRLPETFATALRYLGKDSADVPGVYLEFGVYIGTSLACMYQAATAVGADKLRIIGFDSFEGMPDGVEQEDGSRWHKGELFSDLSLTRQNFARLNVPLTRVELVPGWFEDSLTAETRERLGIATVDIVMVDCVRRIRHPGRSRLHPAAHHGSDDRLLRRLGDLRSRAARAGREGGVRGVVGGTPRDLGGASSIDHLRRECPDVPAVQDRQPDDRRLGDGVARPAGDAGMNVLLTCAGRRSYEIGAFKAAVRGQGLILACDADPNAPALQMADGAFVVPRIDAEDYVDELVRLCAQHGVGLLVPAFEPELPILADRRADFDAVGTTVLVSSAGCHRDVLRQGEDRRLPGGYRHPLAADVPCARRRPGGAPDRRARLSGDGQASLRRQLDRQPPGRR